METGSQIPAAGLIFTVSESSQAYGARSIFRCAQATFNSRWHTDQRLFLCRCQQNHNSQAISTALSGESHEEQLQYMCTKAFDYLTSIS